MEEIEGVKALGAEALLAATRKLARAADAIEADLIVHLGEIDGRKLYLDRAFSSMFAFCVGELGFSEDVACNRIAVARAGRAFPAVVDALASGRVHLAGLRMLAPHLTCENHARVLSSAEGRSKREIEELVAGLVPLAEETCRIQFTASRRLRDKLREAQDLLRHRVPDGNLGVIVEKAVDLLIERVRKERFATGRKPRSMPPEQAGPATSRDIPDAIKRAVYERDQGRCAFVGDRGRRCGATGGLEFHHLDGFAQVPVHDIGRIQLHCRAHNQHAAERMYGRRFMERARAREEPGIRPGADPGTAAVRAGLGNTS